MTLKQQIKREGHPDGRTPPAWLASILRDALRWRKDNKQLDTKNNADKEWKQ